MTQTQIKRKVEEALKKLNVSSAPINVKAIAESYGIKISEREIENDISGFLVRNTKNHDTVIGVNLAHPKNRQRFTIAHELGHYLLHDGDELHIDGQFAIGFRDDKSSEGTYAIEREANFFAAELLMPEKFLREDVANMDSLYLCDDSQLQELATKYGVSSTAMTYRLINLGYNISM